MHASKQEFLLSSTPISPTKFLIPSHLAFPSYWGPQFHSNWFSLVLRPSWNTAKAKPSSSIGPCPSKAFSWRCNASQIAWGKHPKNNPLSNPSCKHLGLHHLPIILSCAGIWNRQCRRISSSGARRKEFVILLGSSSVVLTNWKNFSIWRGHQLTEEGTQYYLHSFGADFRRKDWPAGGDWAK